jgi:hypothetical protein
VRTMSHTSIPCSSAMFLGYRPRIELQLLE